MEISKQEIEYARELAAIRRAKKGIGVSRDTNKSRYARNGGNPNGPADPPQEETLPEEKQPSAAGELRRAVAEEAKRRIKEKVVKEIKKKVLMALLKNPYVLAAIGIIIGVILLIMLIVVIIQSPTATTEDEYETYTTEEGEERTIHMPQLKGL